MLISFNLKLPRMTHNTFEAIYYRKIVLRVLKVKRKNV